MAIFIKNGWDVSHHHTHEAFKHLGYSCRINIEVNAFYEQQKDSLPWQKSLTVANKIRMNFIRENQEAIKAIILFQAGMEAWISWAYTTESLSHLSKPRYFTDKWEEAFKYLNIEYDFSNYADFYRNARNPIVHPSKEADIAAVANISASATLQGFKDGWSANESLSKGIGREFDKNSWDLISEINNVPKVAPDELVDLQVLEKKLREKLLQGMKQA